MSYQYSQKTEDNSAFSILSFVSSILDYLATHEVYSNAMRAAIIVMAPAVVIIGVHVKVAALPSTLVVVASWAVLGALVLLATSVAAAVAHVFPDALYYFRAFMGSFASPVIGLVLTTFVLLVVVVLLARCLGLDGAVLERLGLRQRAPRQSSPRRRQEAILY